ncbi:universal stress protein [Corynebacterium felinum]|uniref:Nucleotide-binding universal stress UspA family protein n=1 Tax=Corynebacterium felinum TaxID=131318 RepID=A0ABU2B4M1_9CORY|nr:universal stress protein [Corynebacterium felinum]MDF5820622.1 universal stress protein [Corynebacterium felinum]MDR7353555.1 nucleotide-binding universal stress UspA family protein [Corynebacterium felinum]WJY95736.1 Universal stress protein family protein [Corynebacterium felinum]
MKLVVGYTATPQGIDAINLAIDAARAFAAEIHVVIVLRRHDIFSHEYPPTGTFDDILLAQAFTWIKGALEQIPDDITARGCVYSDISSANGLQRAAEDLGAEMIVVGGASLSPLKRHRLGTIAQDLLYGSAFPIALAPRGYTKTPIKRINCAVGLRPGAGSLVQLGVQLSRRANVPLRLVGLMGSDEGNLETAAAARRNAQEVLDRVGGHSDIPELQPTVVVEKLDNLEWEPGDVMFVGSSRVAEKKTVFAGSVAMQLLKALSLPLVVVPRDYKVKET